MNKFKPINTGFVFNRFYRKFWENETTMLRTNYRILPEFVYFYLFSNVNKFVQFNFYNN